MVVIFSHSCSISNGQNLTPLQLAQPIRLLLAYVGEEVEEKRYQNGPGKISYNFNLNQITSTTACILGVFKCGHALVRSCFIHCYYMAVT